MTRTVDEWRTLIRTKSPQQIADLLRADIEWPRSFKVPPKRAVAQNEAILTFMEAVVASAFDSHELSDAPILTLGSF